LQALAALAQLPQQVGLLGHHQLGGRRRGPGFAVGDQVSQRPIRGVP
jgi:hypothetical protein